MRIHKNIKGKLRKLVRKNLRERSNSRYFFKPAFLTIKGTCLCCGIQNATLHKNSHIIPFLVLKRMLKDHPGTLGIKLDKFNEKPDLLIRRNSKRIKRLNAMGYMWCKDCESKSGNEDDNYYAPIVDAIQEGKLLKLKKKKGQQKKERLHRFVVSIVIRTLISRGHDCRGLSKIYLNWTKTTMDSFPILVERNNGMILPLQFTTLGLENKKNKRRDCAVVCLGRLSFVMQFGYKAYLYPIVDNKEKKMIKSVFQQEKDNFVKKGFSHLKSTNLFAAMMTNQYSKVAILRSVVNEIDALWIDLECKKFVFLHYHVPFAIEETPNDDRRSVLQFIKEEIMRYNKQRTRGENPLKKRKKRKKK